MTIVQFDVLEVAARLETVDGDDVVGVYQVRYDGVTPMTDVAGLAEVIAFMEVVYTILGVAIPLLSVFRDLTIRNVTQSVNYGTFPWPVLTNGSSAGNDLPPGVAFMASFPTGVSRVTLRKYWGNMSTGSVTLPGLWDAGLVVIGVNAAAALLAGFVGATGNWVYGYVSPKTLGWIEPVSAIVLDVPSYQRRRRQGRGS